MSIKTLAARAAAWAGRRLRERSTYVGLATIAAAIGLQEVSAILTDAGELVGIAIGTGLVTASTSASADAA